MSIHRAIKYRRESLGLSQERLAQLVSEQQPGERAITRQTVAHWERGAAAPKRTRMPAVAAALHTSVSALLAGTVDAAPTAAADPQRAQALMTELLRVLQRQRGPAEREESASFGAEHRPGHELDHGKDLEADGGIDASSPQRRRKR